MLALTVLLFTVFPQWKYKRDVLPIGFGNVFERFTIKLQSLSSQFTGVWIKDSLKKKLYTYVLYFVEPKWFHGGRHKFAKTISGAKSDKSMYSVATVDVEAVVHIS